MSDFLYQRGLPFIVMFGCAALLVRVGILMWQEYKDGTLFPEWDDE